MINVIDLALMLLNLIVSQSTKNQLPAEVVTDIQAAVNSLQKVRGTPVTFQQLEGMRFTPKW